MAVARDFGQLARFCALGKDFKLSQNHLTLITRLDCDRLETCNRTQCIVLDCTSIGWFPYC